MSVMGVILSRRAAAERGMRLPGQPGGGTMTVVPWARRVEGGRPCRTPEPERVALVYTLVIGAIAALYRLGPYAYQYLLDAPAPEVLWNLMPVGAFALFAGSRLRTRFAWLLPVAVMLISDLLLIVPIHWLTKGQYSAF